MNLCIAVVTNAGSDDGRYRGSKGIKGDIAGRMEEGEI
jgi:hypothetical protein